MANKKTTCKPKSTATTKAKPSKTATKSAPAIRKSCTAKGSCQTSSSPAYALPEENSGQKQTRKRTRKTSGFAETKEFPHKKHPARFKKKRGSDDIEYITFTHSSEVELEDVVVITRPLTSNINPAERGTLNEKGEPNISYVYPKVYIGKRSALGKGTNKYSLVEADRKIVDELFNTLPKEEVPKTSNSKSNNKKKT